jgi:hypothetical protein
MNPNRSFDLCRAYLGAASAGNFGRDGNHRTAGPTITISRAAGARGNSIGVELVRLLEEHHEIPRHRPWTLFNNNLIAHVIEEHNLPQQTAEYFPEDKTDEIAAFVSEALGLHPGTHALASKTSETVRRLARAGNSIIVGRGGNLVAANLPHALHVRLVGSEETRANYFARHAGLDQREALVEINRLDKARQRYLKSNFSADINDPALYDLTLNTDRFSDEQTAGLIMAALEEKISSAPPVAVRAEPAV